jgi:hypothetical protein
MRQCVHCQAELPDNAQFCSRCGTPVDANQHRASDDAEGERETEQTQIADEMSLEVKSEEELSQGEQERPAGEEERGAALSQGEQDLVAASEAVRGDAEVKAEQELAASSEMVQDEAEADTATLQAEESPRAEAARPGKASAEQEAGEAGLDAELQTVSEMPTAELAAARDAVSEMPTAELANVRDAVSEMSTAELADLRQAVSKMPVPDTDQPVQDENTLVEPQFSPARQGKGKARRGVVLLIVVLVVVVVLAGGVGALVALRQNTLAGAASQCTGQQSGCTQHTPGAGNAGVTRLVFSGAVSGPLTVSASPDCQATSTGSFRTWMVSLSGVVGEQLYNFGFVINRYHGPGTYSADTASAVILLDLPGEATNNGWGNVAPTDTGGITVSKGEQTGSINAVLSGFGSRKGTQVQVSGNWAC